MTDLEKYSKADLIWIINQMQKYTLSRPIDCAISDLEHRKELDRINEMDKLAKEQDAATKEYIRIMKPYEGKRYMDIPSNVLTKAGEALRKAEAAEKKYMRMLKQDEKKRKEAKKC